MSRTGTPSTLITDSSEGCALLCSLSPLSHTNLPPKHIPYSTVVEYGAGLGLLIHPKRPTLPQPRTFLKKKIGGLPISPRFSSARCFLYECFVLPVHFGGWSFLPPPPPMPAPQPAAPGLQPLGSIWGGVPGSSLPPLCRSWLQLAVLLFNIAPKVF